MSEGIGKAMLLAICLGITGSTAAQIYRHVDEHGVVHFSDTAPDTEDYQVIGQAELEAATTTVPGTRLPNPVRQQGAERPRVQAGAPRTAPPRSAQGTRDANVAVCDGHRTRLAAIQQRLRAGYGIQEGNYLRAERRELNALIARECRGR